MSSANTPKIRLIFKLVLKIVIRSRGDPGESSAKPDVWYYSRIGDELQTRSKNKWSHLADMFSANTPKIRV